MDELVSSISQLCRYFIVYLELKLSHPFIVFKIPHLQKFTPLFFLLLLCIASSEAGSWLIFSAASLPTVSGACSGRGILQVRAGVRGFARSVAPSRLSPHRAQFSDLLLLFMPETIPDY